MKVSRLAVKVSMTIGDSTSVLRRVEAETDVSIRKDVVNGPVVTRLSNVVSNVIAAVFVDSIVIIAVDCDVIKAVL